MLRQSSISAATKLKCNMHFTNGGYMTSEDEKFWIERAQNGDKEALAFIFSQNTGWVKAFLRKYSYKYHEDLLQQAFLGLLYAIYTYKPIARFRTHATFHVKNQIYQYFYWLSNVHKMNPTSRNKYRKRDYFAHTEFLDEYVVESPITDVVVQALEESAILRKAISLLKEKQQKVIYYRFFDGLILEEVAKRLNVTRQRVQQIEQEALKALRKILIAYKIH